MVKMEAIKTALKKKFPEILFSEKLSKYSTFQIGGPADIFFELKQVENLVPILQLCKKHKIPFFIFGGGSNILFDDKGFRGLVIKMKTKNMEINDNFMVTADAGVAVASLIRFSIVNDLTGLEPWSGLPGTIGGAVRGNAGCNGLEVKDILEKALILDLKTCKTRGVDNNYFKFKYRYSRLKKTNEAVISATFHLKKRRISPQEQRRIIQNLQENRISRQPFGASTGSFFRNPYTDRSAGFLIEQAGLKGKTIGRAQISAKHGNFLLNLGGATAKDILKLARLARKTIKAKFGLVLEEEVQILSEKGQIKL